MKEHFKRTYEKVFKEQKYKLFDFTYDNNDIIPCSDVNTLLNSFDKGKIVLELKNKNIIKKKCNIRCLFKDKWCFFGLKLKNDLQKENNEL